jgi:hypothetical protein
MSNRLPPHSHGFTLSVLRNMRDRHTLYLYLSEKYTVMICRSFGGGSSVVYVYNDQVIELSHRHIKKSNLISFESAVEIALDWTEYYSLKSLL